MKLGKEEIQKIFLGSMLLIGLVYCYFVFLLGPLKSKQAAVAKNTESLQPAITDAMNKIAKSAAAEKNAPAADLVLRQIDALIPLGSPVAWFPPQISSFFKERGIDKITTRLVSEGPEKTLPGYQRTSWGLEFPRIEFAPFAAALAQFENEEPLVEITNVMVEVNKDDAEAQHAVMSLNRIVKK